MKRFLVACSTAEGTAAAKKTKSTPQEHVQPPPSSSQPKPAAAPLQLALQLKHNAWTDLDANGSRVAYYPRHLSSMSKRMLAALLKEAPWEQRNVQVLGRNLPQPRLICYMADANLQYTYSGLTLQPTPWSPAVLEVKAAVQQLTGASFNSCLLNQYRAGTDHISWHSDNEPLYGREPTIASVSFGESRDFVLRHNTTKTHKINVLLAAGDVLVMGGATQLWWQHSLPQRKKAVGPRVNLTFRNIIRPEVQRSKQQQQEEGQQQQEQDVHPSSS